MIQVKRKTTMNAIQYTADTHEQIKGIMQQQENLISDNGNSLTLVVTNSRGDTTNIDIIHNDWIIELRADKFYPFKEIAFDSVFEITNN
mgnify:CR=1 FL=1